MNLVIFHPLYINSGCNSSYSFVPIIMKLFLYGVMMCMWFGFNCLVIFFFHFFYIVNLVIFHPQHIDSGYLMSTTRTILYRFFFFFETLYMFSP